MTDLTRIEAFSLREVDLLVAEKIFGWSDFWRSPSLSDRIMGYPPNEQAMGIDGERHEVWNYSTDIKAAWSVVDVFYSADIGKYFDAESGKARYKVYLVTTNGESNVDGRADADTVELAICLAALNAKDIEVIL